MKFREGDLSNKFNPGAKAKGAAKTDLARRQPGTKPTGSLVAESFSPNPGYGSRPRTAPQPINSNISGIRQI